MIRRMSLFSITYIWFLVLIILPVAGIVAGALQHGVSSFTKELAAPEALFSLKLTAEITLCTVSLNTIAGVLVALHIARKGVGWKVFNVIVDLPFAVSPVIAGLALVLMYGPNTFVGGVLQHANIKFIFAMPGMVAATLFVTFPFVVRELVPHLMQIGIGEEEAAFTLGAGPWVTFWKVTFPEIKWSVMYGVMLTISRSLGEFGAVLVVSGSVIMVTQSATLYVYQATADNQMAAAYAVSLVLAAGSFVTLILLQLTKRKQGSDSR
ncbi:sulfate ABC transporter permease subunit [Alicyclobacillus fastidiosus]|uniref:Sulfate ABC transporter permease subunit n=1 Tax=Alicyclobacillus fastidiosus TaxID=392011 RepID=A0ABV5A9R6_9BACL|nr:sulfate ABC transporter permease subunit [Alicyclobacillus fastidiosus]WEH10930.1 sulfate ABC transporter permease subunit [Alicyclobacillus fastidiosus]